MPKTTIIDLEEQKDGSFSPSGEVEEVEHVTVRPKRKLRKKQASPLDLLEGVEKGVTVLLRTKRLFDKLLNRR